MHHQWEEDTLGFWDGPSGGLLASQLPCLLPPCPGCRMHIVTVNADLLRGGQAPGSQRAMLRFALLSSAVDLPPLGHILAPELPPAPPSLHLIQGVHAVHAALRRRVPIVSLMESGVEGVDAGGTTVLPLSLDRGIMEQVE